MSDFNLKIIEDFCKECGIINITEFFRSCSNLKNLLFEENKKYNLTRISEDKDFWNKHIADSLSIARSFPELRKENLRIADVGCGAGFPSLVLAIAFKNLKITAIDSIQKKINFVALVAEKLDLKNIDVCWGRARELKRNAEYDYITARAVGEPIKIFRETRKWLKKEGKVIIFQTPKTDTVPIETLNKWTEKFAYAWKQSKQFELPGGEKRTFVYAVNNDK